MLLAELAQDADIWASIDSQRFQLSVASRARSPWSLALADNGFAPRSTDNLGLMPYRHPIVTVGACLPSPSPLDPHRMLTICARPPSRGAVGRPVHVVQHDNPTNEQLYETQQRYIDELLRIWETYKVQTFSRGSCTARLHRH